MSEFGGFRRFPVVVYSVFLLLASHSLRSADAAGEHDSFTYYFTHQTNKDGVQRGLLHLPRSKEITKGKLESAFPSEPFPGTEQDINVSWSEDKAKLDHISFAMSSGKVCELTASGSDERYLGSCTSSRGDKEAFNAHRTSAKSKTQLEGRFTWVSAPSFVENIEKKIENVTRSMNFFVRPFARKQLRFLLRPSAYFEFTKTSDGISVQSDAVSRRCFFDGRKSSFLNRRKERTQTRCSVFALGLQEYFYGEGEGTWVHNFTLSQNGQRLFQTVYVTYPGFISPLRLTLEFARQPAKVR
ncbi:MAG: hypothetical protein VYC39_14025 [Myxococcota bacterium]|nr:hypothetical protein [Myxococcota bacterium]